jgi:hypothetical protein
MAAEHLVSFGALDVWVSSSEGIPRVTAREWVSNETHLDGRRSSALEWAGGVFLDGVGYTTWFISCKITLRQSL